MLLYNIDILLMKAYTVSSQSSFHFCTTIIWMLSRGSYYLFMYLFIHLLLKKTKAKPTAGHTVNQ